MNFIGFASRSLLAAVLIVLAPTLSLAEKQAVLDADGVYHKVLIRFFDKHLGRKR